MHNTAVTRPVDPAKWQTLIASGRRHRGVLTMRHTNALQPLASHDSAPSLVGADRTSVIALRTVMVGNGIASGGVGARV